MDRWYSIVEYARQFNLSDMTVRRRIKNGKLQAVLKDGKYFIPISSSTSKKSIPSTNQISSDQNESTVSTNEIPAQSQSLSYTNQNGLKSNSNIFPKNTPQVSGTDLQSRSSQPTDQTLVHPRSFQERSNISLSTTDRSYNSGKIGTGNQDGLKNKFYPRYEKSSRDEYSLITNYDNLVQQFKRFEKILEDSYTAKIHQLESEIKVQKLENSNLKQQVEDLQVLIKLIEKRK